jgi:hypothetical protein
MDQSTAAIIQAVSAAIVALLTIFLVGATIGYARTAEKLLRLSHEQFERDWRPDLRIADMQRSGPGQVYLKVANLAKPAVLVKELKIGSGGRTKEQRPPQDVDTYPLILLVPGGQIYGGDAWIHPFLGAYRQKHSAPPTPFRRTPWETWLNIALVYDAAGKTGQQTVWFDCVVIFEDLTVVNVQVQPS